MGVVRFDKSRSINLEQASSAMTFRMHPAEHSRGKAKPNKQPDDFTRVSLGTGEHFTDRLLAVKPHKRATR